MDPMIAALRDRMAGEIARYTAMRTHTEECIAALPEDADRRERWMLEDQMTLIEHEHAAAMLMLWEQVWKVTRRPSREPRKMADGLTNS